MSTKGRLIKSALVVLGASILVQPLGGVFGLAQDAPKKEDTAQVNTKKDAGKKKTSNPAGKKKVGKKNQEKKNDIKKE